MNGTAAIKACRKAAAVLTVAVSCSWAKANFENRSTATKRHSFAFFGADLGDVDMNVADRVGLERSLARPVAAGFGQPADAVALETAVQRGI